MRFVRAFLNLSWHEPRQIYKKEIVTQGTLENDGATLKLSA